MNVKELIALIKQANPALAEIEDNKVAVILREAFSLIRDQIETAGDEPVKFVGLGSFRVREVIRESDDGKEEIKRRVFFTPATPKAS